MKNEIIKKGDSELVIYESKDGSIKLDVSFRDEKVIRKHINNVFADGELDKENNTQKMRVVTLRKKY